MCIVNQREREKERERERERNAVVLRTVSQHASMRIESDWKRPGVVLAAFHHFP